MSSPSKVKNTILHQMSPGRDTQLRSDFLSPVETDTTYKSPRRQGGSRASRSTGRRSHLRKQSLSNKSIASSLSSDRRSNTAVYVKDAAYVWLPAQILSSTEERAMVKIVIPDDWADTTVLSDKSSITALEYETTSGGFGNYMSPKFGQSDFGKGGDQKRKCYSYERDHLEYDESMPKGIQRTISLHDYPNMDLPLQNTDRHAERLLSTRSLQQKNTIYHPLVNARDMADLHYLHEAAILYNLKQRHAQNLPYTRVGDIVVAVNPFEWIGGLYSSEKQGLYAHHLIWDAKDYELDEKQSESEHDDVSELGNISEIGSSVVNDTLGDSDAHAPLTPKGKTISFQIKYSEATKNNDSEPAAARHEPMAHGSIYSRLGLEPHVYETASLAYRGLASNRENQTILVSGESGAGKTETVKIVMSNLATIEQTRPSNRSHGQELFKLEKNEESVNPVVKKVLESNPVFEAFGCAKTVRNDNSSRFGRFTQLQYEVENKRDAELNSRVVLPTCLLRGSFCATYLLEKSRVVSHARGERNYHIFYQLLSSPDDEKALIWDDLVGCSKDSFAYIGNSTATTIEGKPDSENWCTTVESLKSFGFTGDSYRHLMRALCVVLQLGNLTFSPARPSFEEGSTISSPRALVKLSQLIGIPEEIIEKAMTTRISLIRGEEVVARPNPRVAKEGCDALAKTIYACIFDTLVKQINDHTSVGPGHGSSGTIGTISLLDIFGFERFEVNRFEQLCINFSNERLQHRYVLDNFRAVKEEYTAEGIEIFDFSMVDNSGVLELLEGKLGLITSLNEECVRPQGKPSSFVYKLKMLHNDSKHLLVDRLQQQCEFGIKHFAGAVTYDANEFLKSNADLTPKDLLICASRSTNPLIQRELEMIVSDSSGKRGPPRRAVARTVMAKFRSQLNFLMNSIEETKSRYIRCIKPNTNMLPKMLNHRETMNQLESAGLVTAITISRETFPNRLPYDVIWERFQCLDKRKSFANSVRGNLSNEEIRKEVESLLKSILLKPFTRTDGARVPSYCCGNTRVYFRTGALEHLESDRMLYYSSFASKIGKWYRCQTAQLKFQRFRYAVIVLQAYGRKKVDLKKFRSIRNAAVVIQKVRRMVLQRRAYIKSREAGIQIQAKWRQCLTRRFYRKSLLSIVLLQSLFRAIVTRQRYCAQREASIAVQSFWRGCSARILTLLLVKEMAFVAKTRREAAIKIQAWFKCQIARRAYEEVSQTIKIKSSDGVGPNADLPIHGSRRISSDSTISADFDSTKEELYKVRRENKGLLVDVETQSRQIIEMNDTLEAIQHENRECNSALRNELRSAEDQMKSMLDENLQLDSQKTQLEASVALMRTEVELLQNKIFILAKDKMSIQRKCDALKDNESALEKDRSEYQDLVEILRSNTSKLEEDASIQQGKLDDLQTLVTSLQSDIQLRDESFHGMKMHLAALEAENEDMDSELKASYNELNQTKVRIEHLEKEADEMNAELEASIKTTEDLKSSLGAKTIEANDLLSGLESSRNENNSLKSQVFSLLQNIEDGDKRGKILQVQILSLEDSIVELKQSLHASEERCHSLTTELTGCKSSLEVQTDQMANLENLVDAKEVEVSSLRDKVFRLEDVIETKDGEIGGLKDTISSLNYTIEERNQASIIVQNEVASLKDTLAERDSAIDDLKNKSESLNRELGLMQLKAVSLEENVASQKVVIVSLEEKTKSGDDAISGFKEQVANFENNVLELSDKNKYLRENVSSLELEIKEVLSDLERSTTENTKIRENVESLEGKLRDRDEKLAIIQILNDTLENTTKILKSEATNFKDQLESTVVEKNSLNNALRKSETQSGILAEQGEALRNQNEDLETKIFSLREEISTLRSTISTLERESIADQNKIDSLDSRIADLEKNVLTKSAECVNLKSEISSLVEEKEDVTLKYLNSKTRILQLEGRVNEVQCQLGSRDEIVRQSNDELNALKVDVASRDDELSRQKERILILEHEKEKVVISSENQGKTLKDEIDRLKEELERQSLEITDLKHEHEVSVARYEETRKLSESSEEEEEKEIILLRELVDTLKHTINEYNEQALRSKMEIQGLEIANESLVNAHEDEVNALKKIIDDYNSQSLEYATEIENLKLSIESIRQSEVERSRERAAQLPEPLNLEKDLASIQVENSTMKDEIHNLEQSKAELINEMQSLVTASKSATNRSQALLQTNKNLLVQINQLQLENAKMKRHLIEGDHEERALPHSTKIQCNRIVHDRESEVAVLREALADSMRGRELFAQSVEKKMAREREVLLTEIHSLKEKFQKAKDTSDDYKQKIIDVLETSHATKETQIRKLKKEVKRLKEESQKATSGNVLSSMAKQRRSPQIEGKFHFSKRDMYKKASEISNLVQEFRSGINEAEGNPQIDMINQIIDSVEEFCKSEGQQSTEVPTTPTTGEEGWIPYPPPK